MSIEGSRDSEREFSVRVRIGDYEVELKGSRKEVMDTIGELPKLMTDFSRAFNMLRPKSASTVTIKAIATGSVKETPMENCPKIPKADSCSEAILKVLESDWGKWRPRTLMEIKAVLEANGMFYSGSTLANELLKLVKDEKVKRWKTDKGYVYIITEKEILADKKGLQ